MRRWVYVRCGENRFCNRTHISRKRGVLHYDVTNYKQTSGRCSLICPNLFLSITVYRNERTKRNSKTFLPVRSPKTLNNFATRRRFSTPPLSVTETGNYFLWVMWEHKAISFKNYVNHRSGNGLLHLTGGVAAIAAVPVYHEPGSTRALQLLWSLKGI